MNMKNKVVVVSSSVIILIVICGIVLSYKEGKSGIGILDIQTEQIIEIDSSRGEVRNLGCAKISNNIWINSNIGKRVLEVDIYIDYERLCKGEIALVNLSNGKRYQLTGELKSIYVGDYFIHFDYYENKVSIMMVYVQ